MNLLEYGRIAFSIAFPWSLGYVLLAVILGSTRMALVLRLAISYLLGLGVLTQWMLILNVLGWSHAWPQVFFPLFLLMVLLGGWLALHARCRNVTASSGAAADVEPAVPIGPFWEFALKVGEVLLAIFILYWIFYIFWRALNIPVYGFDPIYINVWKAKTFFFDQSVSPGREVYQQAYPLHLPLAQAWIALTLNRWDDQWIKLIFPLNCLSFLTVQFYVFWQQGGRRWALLGVFLLLSANLFNLHAAIAYMDFTLMVYYVTALVLLLLWHEHREQAFLILAGLFAGLAANVKREGILFFLIYGAVMIQILRDQKGGGMKGVGKKVLSFLVPGLLVLLPFAAYRMRHLIPAEVSRWDVSGPVLGRTVIVIEQFLQDLFLSGNWNILWMLLFVSALAAGRLRPRRQERLLWSALAMHVGLYVLLFACTNNFRFIETGTTVSRLLLHFFPLAVMLIVMINTRACSRAGPGR